MFIGPRGENCELRGENAPIADKRGCGRIGGAQILGNPLISLPLSRHGSRQITNQETHRQNEFGRTIVQANHDEIHGKQLVRHQVFRD